MGAAAAALQLQKVMIWDFPLKQGLALTTLRIAPAQASKYYPILIIDCSYDADWKVLDPPCVEILWVFCAQNPQMGDGIRNFPL